MATSETLTLNTTSLESLAPVRTNELTEKDLLAYFQNTWDLYEVLFSGIQKEGALYVNPDPLRHPLIFYLGHTAAFYVNKMVLAGLISESERINPHFELIFEKGVDPARAEELGSEAWPSVEAVKAFRIKVYELVCNFIKSCEYRSQVNMDHPLWAILMSIEHDRIHFETSSMLIRQYPVEWLSKPKNWNYAPSRDSAPTNTWLDVPETTIKLGKPDDFPTFGWDNEYGNLIQKVDRFEASKNLITNEEFLEFVNDNGYERPEFWYEEAWQWRNKFNVEHPKFWIKTPGRFRYRAVFDELEMPMDWPVEVNQYEAQAYCNWRGEGSRLMTEREFQAIAQTCLKKPFDLPYTDHYNVNLRFCSPSPVGMLSNAGSTLGFNDVWGNVWCWLSDDFYALPGFEIHPYYEDFSEPYMDSNHAMLLGGAWASSGTSASRYYRLWFRRHFYQHAGFRVARDK